MRLLKFVCSFAWTDLHVSDAERALVTRLCERHGFDADERAMVAGWLKVPPRPEEVDPTQIPRDHRHDFVAAVRAMVAADGVVVRGERDSLALFEELVRDAD